MNTRSRRQRLQRVLLAALLGFPGGAALAAAASAPETTEEQRFFESKCGSCHPSERIFLVRLNPEQRRHYVLKMRARLEAGRDWLSDAEVERVLAYVDAADGTAGSVQPTPSDDPKQLFRERCKGCHELDRVYQAVRDTAADPSAWLHVVTRMQAKAPEWIAPGEARKIVDYLERRMVPTPRD